MSSLRQRIKASLVVCLPAAAVVATGALLLPDLVRRADAAPPDAKAPAKYQGASTCAGSSCHSAAEPRAEPPFLQEHSTWKADHPFPDQLPATIPPVFDRHSYAWQRLLEEHSAQIMNELNKIEKTKDKAEDSPRCLSCHGVSVHDYGVGAANPGAPVSLHKELIGGKFSAEDGVSCDGCHGPASNYLKPHTEKDWAPKNWAAKGGEKDKQDASHKLYDESGIYYSKDLELWAGQCVRCHLAIDTHQIDAGHPDLVPFELFGQSEVLRVLYGADGSVVSTHWRDYHDKKFAGQERLPGAGPFHGVRSWQTGQAGALWSAASQLSLRAAGDKKSHNDSPNQEQHVQVAFNRLWGHYVVLRHALEKADADALKGKMEGDAGLQGLMAAKKWADVAKVAGEIAAWAKKPGEKGGLTRKMADHKRDAASTKALIVAIAGDPGTNANRRTREQTGMGLYAIYASYAREVPPADPANDPVLNGIYAMFGCFADGDEFKAAFEAALKGVKGVQ